jgi:transcriptional regulator of heat shock response
MITDRQADILDEIIREYIKLAAPVSSHSLKKKKGLDVSSATIRNEMQKLTDEGYLCQPHISAGRVPTDKGYRFFVNQLFEHFPKSAETLMDIEDQLFIREITRSLSKESSSLVLGYSAADKIFWKEGWQDIFEEPEFQEPGLAAAFVKMIDDLEENIGEMLLPEIQVYIGGENPFSKIRDFSIIASGFDGGVFAILGPKRMSYDKNINLMQKIWKKK